MDRSGPRDVSSAPRDFSDLLVRYRFHHPFLAEGQNPLLRMPYAAVVVLCLPAAVLGLAVANYAIASRLGDPPIRWRRWFRCFATIWLVSPDWLVLLAVILAMPNEIGIRARGYHHAR
jgi:thiosulfate reductase cytochrome b subunit